MLRVRVYFGIVFAVLFAGTCHSVDLKPKAFPLSILGVKVEIPTAISFDARTDADAMALQVRIVAGFGEVQDKALEIARRIPVPRDNCAHKGFNVVVNSIDSASITAGSKMAVIDVAGRLTVWACQDVLGVTAKTTVVSDSMELSIPLQVAIVSQKELGVRLFAPVTVRTGNKISSEIAKVFAGDINSRITAELGHALDAKEARATLPALPGLDAVITSAEFDKDGPRLTLRAEGSGKINADTFAALLGSLNK